MKILTPSQQKDNVSAQPVSASISNHLGTDAQDIFETELAMGTRVIAQYLLDVKENKSTIKLDLGASAVRDLYYKGRLNTSALPMTDSDKLRLEMLLYHYETDLLQKGLIRRNIEREYRYTAKAFDRTYQDFRNGLTPGVDPDELLRLEIKALMAETDAIKKARKKRDIATRFGMSYGLIDQMIASIRQETQQNKVERLSLHDFFNQDLQEADWLVPGLLPKGEMALLTAMPKVGKTLLAVDLAFCLATGESSFLGESVKPAKVLFISVDESKKSTRAKLRKRGFRHEDNLECLFGWDISQLPELEKTLEDFRPDLTIIDSLKRITAGKEVSENSAEFADMVYQLKETLERYGSAGLLIHHSNKNKEFSGLASIRGSSAIPGAVWGAWQLDYPKQKGKPDSYNPGDLDRTLTISARDSEGQTIHLTLDLENNSFTRVLTESDHEKRSQAAQVLDVLANHPYGLNGKAIAHLTGIKSIYSVLNRLCERGQIESFPAPDDNRRMIYRLKAEEKKFTPPSTYEASQPTQTAETQTQQEEKIDHRLDHKHSISENQPTIEVTPPSQKTTRPTPSRGFAKHNNLPDERQQLLLKVKNCVKANGLSDEELGSLISKVYGDDSAPLEKLGSINLECLLEEMEHLVSDRSIK